MAEIVVGGTEHVAAAGAFIIAEIGMAISLHVTGCNGRAAPQFAFDAAEHATLSAGVEDEQRSGPA